MFSKWTLKMMALLVSLLTGVAIFLCGCDAHIGEKPPAEDVYEYSGAECLSSATPIVKNFVQGIAQDKDVNAFWNCVGAAVAQFKKNVRGSTADRYTPQEIATFLEKNFFDKTKKTTISPTLQNEFMKIKQLMIGGARDSITRHELDLTQETFEVLRKVTVGLNPYMKILAMNWSADKGNKMQENMAYFEEANLAVQKAAGTLADLFEKNGQNYALADFVSVTEELSKFLGEDWAFTKAVEKYMPVVQKVKKALAGGDEKIVAANEWRRFALLGSRGYVQYLRYHYFIKSSESSGSGYRLAYLSRTIEDLLSAFEDLTAQKPEGVVSRDEVTDLLLTLSRVWPDFKISNNLVIEFMKVKQMMFGGKLDSFTKDDFSTARLKVSRLKTLVERFMPYWPIYGHEWDKGLYSPDEAQKFFMESQGILEATGRELGSLMEGSYDLRDLTKLVSEFEALYPPEDPARSLSKTIAKYLPLLVDSKKLLVGGSDSSVKKEKWTVVFSFGARAYTDYLYYDYFLKNEDWSRPDSVNSLSVIANQSLNILRDVLQNKDNKQIVQAELSVLAKDFIDLKIMPKGIDQKAADQLITVVTNNILITPEHRIGGVVPNALTLESVEVARRELQVWLDTELFIANASEKWGPNEGLSPANLLLALNNGLKGRELSASLAEGLKELIYSVDSSAPLTVDSEGRIQISNKVDALYTRKSLRQLNIDRALSRLAIRSFVGDLSRINSYAGATLQEVQAAFAQVKVVFVQMGLLNEKNNTFGDARFRDANLFTPHANGDGLASFQEMTDLVAMIWSGLNINSNLKSALLSDCLGNMENPKDDTPVKFDCARKSYKKSMANYMLATPEYLKFMKSAEASGELDVYIQNVFKTAGYVPNPQRMARWGDLSLAPHVVQYIEMLFARFDRNKDGYISTAEALRAYPLFKGLLLEFAKDQIKSGSISEDDLPAIFCFMLHYGKPPETLKEKILFLFKWKGKDPSTLDIWEDRGSLAQVLGYVADRTNKVPTAEIPNIDRDLPKE